MASCDLCQRQRISALLALAEEASCWCCVFMLVTLLLLLNCFDQACTITNGGRDGDEGIHVKAMSSVLELDRACDEIYVVGEGETLNSIVDKCGDPSIVEHNPHIHDPDDVIPGFVIKVKPAKSRKSLN
ncbi:hypothetical protein like AT3G52790 [Hibiscus trionum]|uniref:LysM domain-containing protein n=1 Tax=Hibiscus trionum TaxID=183268 RepID=A0A9W7H2S0_HIBTR|nr:hypothetical protein like AT3G52790 [Hibiscus trionum]